MSFASSDALRLRNGDDHMSSWERKFSKYAIPNLSLVLIVCYAVGYLLERINASFLNYLTLNPYAILHGQIWRIVTWILVPPDSSNLFFIVIMLLFYYSIGTALERVWGDYRYNVYLFSGFLFTVAAAFAAMGFSYLLPSWHQLVTAFGPELYFMQLALCFSTYYVNMSIFLAYAVTFPEARVLLMYIIPVKVKWLGVAYAVMLVVEFFADSMPNKCAIAGSLLNFLLFWFRSRDLRRFSPKEVKRRAAFRNAVNSAGQGKGTGTQRTAQRMNGHYRPVKGAGPMHRCAVCGRTEVDNPNLEFRYCSKCEGNYEYCQDHIFTHVHVKGKSNLNADGTVRTIDNETGAVE